MTTGRTPIARAAHGFRRAIRRPIGEIVHVGHSALVLGGDDGLVIVTTATGGLMPGGLCVLDEAEHAGIRTQILNGDPIALNAWVRARSDLIDDADLRVESTSVDPAAVDLMWNRLRIESARIRDRQRPLVAVDPIRARAPRLVQAAVAADLAVTRSGALHAELTSLIGAGPGTTPSGDDVIVGVLAGLRATGRADAAERIAAHLPGLLTTTTRASRHYLSAACRGEFGEHVHDLVGSLSDTRSATDAVTRATSWGASSGIDLACGLVAAASVGAAIGTIERIA